MWLLAGGWLVDADVAPADGGEGLAVPPAPPVPEPEAGDAGHEVEFGRVGQAEANRGEGYAVGADAEVVVVEDLGDRVVVADPEDDMVHRDFLGVDELMAWAGWGGGDLAFEHEYPAGHQVARGVVKASDLVILGEQVPMVL